MMDLQLTAPLKDAKLNRYFNILKLALVLMPFLCLGYLTIGAGGASLTADGVLAGNPAMAVSFLSAMIQPYAAWLVILAERRLADGRTDWAIINLSLLLAAELMLMSTVGVIGLGLILWKTSRAYGLRPTAAFRQCGKSHFVREAGGSVLVILLAGLCLFAMSRLGLAF